MMMQHRAPRYSVLYAGLHLALSTLVTPVAHAELRDIVNELRNGGCVAHSKLAPLRTDKRLQGVAKQLAGGATTQQATQAMAYPSMQLSTIHLSGYTRDAEVRQLLHDKYCPVLMKPEWQHISNEWRGNELWIVLAVPHAIPTDQEAVAQQVLVLVNQARSTSRRCGNEHYAATTPLRLSGVLSRAAQLHADDMARYETMQHAGSDGSSPAQRITRQGYRWQAVGENIAAGAGSAAEVVAGWLTSPGHCANIMSSQFTEMGLAFAVNPHDDYAVYWTQNFATPR
jgi:uncharacterized protein YkwD